MDNKIKVSVKIVCVACLGSKRIQQITEEQLLQCYNSILEEIPVSIYHSKPSMCLKCTDLLKKYSAFKEKVKESYRSLHLYADEIVQNNLPEIETDNNCHEILAKPEPIDLPDYVDIDIDVKEEIKVEHEDDGPKTETEAVEDSVDNVSEMSANNDTIDAEHEVVKAEIEVKKPKKRRKLNDPIKKEQRFKTIELSHEEMLQERQKEATREAYLNADYRCTSCYVVFSYQQSLNAHMRRNHNPKIGDYSCPVCCTIVSSVEAFTAHYKRHMRRYECIVCKKRSSDLQVIQQHLYTVHDNLVKSYKCSLCAEVFKSKDASRYHRDTHHGRRFQCNSCDKSFRHRNGLINHRTAVHEPKRKIICAQCGKEFLWKTSLKRHEESQHATRQPPSGAAPACALCDITFKCASSYLRHMTSSLRHVSKEQLKFICNDCGKRFSNKTKLRDHIEEKHLHRKFTCHICNKPSKNRVALDQHIRNIHKGRPNNKICHQCGKGFPTKVQLESHIRTHTGERPFICEYCPTTFSQPSNLYKHNKQVHKNMKQLLKKADENPTQDSIKPEGPSTSVPEAPVSLSHPSFAM